MNERPPCYICGEIKEAIDKGHPSRCRDCKREQSRVYASEQRQARLELLFNKKPELVSFCECGNYYWKKAFEGRINYSMCPSCRRDKN